MIEPTHYWAFEQAGHFVTIELQEDKALQETVRQSLGDMPFQVVSEPKGIILQVKTSADGWSIIDTDDQQTREVQHAGDLAYFLSDKIIYHFANRITEGHCLHAACVAKGNNAIIIPANSGHGKSSLTCWLVANGFDYVSDELVVLSDEHTLSGIARPLQIKSSGINAIQPLLKDESTMMQGQIANALPAKAFGGKVTLSSELILRLMLFPHYQVEYGYSFESLKSSLAAMELMGTHVNARNLDAHGFKMMSQTARQIPSYSLKYGGFDHLPATFVGEIERLIESDKKL